MVRLTADLIEQSAQYTNPVRDRELDLRGNVLPFSPARSFSFTQIFNFQFRIIIFRLIRVPGIRILLFLFSLCGAGGGGGANGSHCCVVND